jgi:hypothetical protein
LIAYLFRSNITVDSYATFACGALAGGIAAALTTPADVAKTYRQIELGRSKYSPNNGCITCSSMSMNQPIQSTRTLSILLHILRVEGPNGLFAGIYSLIFYLKTILIFMKCLGLVPRLLKVAPGKKEILIFNYLFFCLACAIMITSFESLKSFFQRMNMAA